ncbi:MAG: hypothetical protein CMJ18_06675 [Phycisphaeraceae bacterium]|nr:hypothetical protein [Phycisphaeraceae bacterium]
MGQIAYAEEWKRTGPDLVVYLPDSENGHDSANQHLLVVKAPGGAWLAFWTMGADEGQPNQSVVVARSTDRGRTWTAPAIVDGRATEMDPNFRAPINRDRVWRAAALSDEAAKDHAGMASWGFPVVVPEMGRVYCFYWKCTGVADFRYDISGALLCRYSDDDGVTWSDDRYEIPLQRTCGDNPDQAIPVSWIIWQTPLRTDLDEIIAPFTCWNSAHSPAGPGSESYFMRFDNILTERDPALLTTTTFPESARGLRVPSAIDPKESFCEEPALVELSDGRFYCVMRTDAGFLSFSMSNDRSRTWSPPAPVYRDHGGPLMLHPVTPAPLYRMRDGRFLLLYCNNNGDANGGHFPCRFECWRENRWPAFASIGREDEAHPARGLRFGPPKVLINTDGAPIGVAGRRDAGSYPSLLEDDNERILFYPDRKHFLLGKFLTDEWLADCDPDLATQQSS